MFRSRTIVAYFAILAPLWGYEPHPIQPPTVFVEPRGASECINVELVTGSPTCEQGFMFLAETKDLRTAEFRVVLSYTDQDGNRIEVENWAQAYRQLNVMAGGCFIYVEDLTKISNVTWHVGARAAVGPEAEGKWGQ